MKALIWPSPWLDTTLSGMLTLLNLFTCFMNTGCVFPSLSGVITIPQSFEANWAGSNCVLIAVMLLGITWLFLIFLSENQALQSCSTNLNKSRAALLSSIEQWPFTLHWIVSPVEFSGYVMYWNSQSHAHYQLSSFILALTIAHHSPFILLLPITLTLPLTLHLPLPLTLQLQFYSHYRYLIYVLSLTPTYNHSSSHSTYLVGQRPTSSTSCPSHRLGELFASATAVRACLRPSDEGGCIPVRRGQRVSSDLWPLFPVDRGRDSRGRSMRR